MVDKQRIYEFRYIVMPVMSAYLFKVNYEGKGEQDKEEFERDFNAILDLALLGLEKAQKEPAFWIVRKWGFDAKCSNCGKTLKDVYDMDNHDRYCRSCGCEMVGIRGESDDSLF